jgi:uncharacterized protein (TIGR03435 family)
MRLCFGNRLPTLILSTAVAAAVGLICAAENTQARNQSEAQSQSEAKTRAPLSFDAASIRERGSGAMSAPIVGLAMSPGRLTESCGDLSTLVYFAYHLTISSPVEGFPEWGHAGCGSGYYVNTYVFQATMPPDTTEEQAREMMKNFLADRFKMTVHWEKKNMPIYELVPAPGGFKLKQNDPTKDALKARGSYGCPPEDRGCHTMVTGATTLAEFAGQLGFSAGRPVIDKTGITGDYYMDLQWAGDTSPDSPLPSLAMALKDQFGLTLKSDTGPVDVLVIDHVERPTPN